jgi:lipopolysaccharide transport system ATP-binding protein
MTEPVIKVENLSKQYRLGVRQGYKTFQEAIVRAAKAPFRNFGKFNPQSAIRNPQSDTIWALKDVSFDVKQGEVVGVIGRNGAGKSTLLKVLSRITEPTSGRVELKGRVGSLLEVGTGFHPELTGHENIYLYGAILGMDRWEVTRKFDEIVAFSELEKFIETPVKRYSSGMYTRLAFAVAAHLEPEILLVDEVLAVGDMTFQEKCLGKMESVSGEGRTVLFVSHNMAAIQGLCHKAMVLDGGKTVYAGETLQTIEYYTLNGNICSDTKISLKNHPNRLPGCKSVLQEIEILSNGEASTNIGMGETLELLVTFDSEQPIHALGVAVEDTLGRRLFVVSPRFTNPTLLGSSTKSAKLICTIPLLPLLPGLYYLTIGVTGFSGTLDKIEKAASISVSERDVFKSGGNSSKMKGVFFTHSDWRMEIYD